MERHESEPRPGKIILQRLAGKWKEWRLTEPPMFTETEARKIYGATVLSKEGLRPRLHEKFRKELKEFDIIRSQIESFLVAWQEVLFQRDHYVSTKSESFNRQDLESITIVLRIVEGRVNIGDKTYKYPYGQKVRPEPIIIRQLAGEWKKWPFVGPGPSLDIVQLAELQQVRWIMRERTDTLRNKLHLQFEMDREINNVQTQIQSLLAAWQEVLFQKRHYDDSEGSFEMKCEEDLESMLIFLEVAERRASIGLYLGEGTYGSAEDPTNTGNGDGMRDTNVSKGVVYNMVDSLDKIIDTRKAHHKPYSLDVSVAEQAKNKSNDGSRDDSTDGAKDLPPEQLKVQAALDMYRKQRETTVNREGVLGFDWRCTQVASEEEVEANKIIQVLRRNDNVKLYRDEKRRIGYGGQLHPRFAGDRFLDNRPLIDKTHLFQVVRAMPKGAHLHIHFNACLPPKVLINIAQNMDRMFITSNRPLRAENDFMQCEIQFSILSEEKEKPGKVFYKSDEEDEPGKPKTIKFGEFIDNFPQYFKNCEVDEWLIGKLEFQEQEAYNSLQTPKGAWKKFNARTRMMKGLFNYESAYRKYTELFLQDLVDDNIQYAEIRPNFMNSNQLWTDDGKKQIDNVGIMNIIIDEYKKFQENTAQKPSFGGLKVIYCTPRSFSKEAVRKSLKECLEFKKQWPEWIAGFDLVGEEAAGYPLKHFVEEFLEFKKDCQKEGVDIPFLFHCGETIDMGDDTDGNVFDALLLGAKRIGHGFSLARHPYVMQRMKKEGVCLEICPISNEILGLTPRINGHAMYNLLAHDVHCTINSDNGTLFRSTLSHDFYQAMVGKKDMTLHGCRQLIQWSLEHSCMSDGERESVWAAWEKRWKMFLRWILDTYRDVGMVPEPDKDENDFY